MPSQAASKILLVKPKVAFSNPETAFDNVYQQKIDDPDLIFKIHKEFDAFSNLLHQNNIDVLLVEDESGSPDAIFPNNIFIFQSPKALICSVYSKIRRTEKANLPNIIKHLNSNYKFQDFSTLEKSNNFCEGTGSLIFDHKIKMVFASISNRTTQDAAKKVADFLGYQLVSFESLYNQKSIYHTNVMLSITNHLAIVCFDVIQSEKSKADLKQIFLENEKEILEISTHQKVNFAANCLEVLNKKGESKLVISKSAFKVLTKSQINLIEKYHQPVIAEIPLIEKVGGGSVRCMMAELF